MCNFVDLYNKNNAQRQILTAQVISCHFMLKFLDFCGNVVMLKGTSSSIDNCIL